MTDKKVIPIKQMPLSYSRISLYKQCPRKFDYTNVSCLIQFQENEFSRFGNQVHKELELYAKNQLKTTEMSVAQQYAPITEKIMKLSGQKYYESKIALNYNYEVTDYFSKLGVMLRCIRDVLVINGTNAQILDYKTGKRKYAAEAEFELEIFALATFIEYPQVDRIKTSLIWLKEDVIDSKIYEIKDIPRIQKKLEEIKEKIFNDLETGSFAARPGPLCNYCGAVDFCDRK